MKHKTYYQALGKYYHENKSFVNYLLMKKVRVFFNTFTVIQNQQRIEKIKICSAQRHQDLNNLSSSINDEWIKKINDDYREIADDINKKWNKKYNDKPQNKISREKYRAKRLAKISSFDIPKDEKKLMSIFYDERPEGYDIDHITPLSKGGEHRLYNLQWLPLSINRTKGSKLIPSLSSYPHCRLDLKEIL